MQGITMKIKSLAFLLTLILIAPIYGQEQDLVTTYRRQLVEMEPQIEALRAEWNIPGVAIAVVYGDETIYTKGFGYRDLDKKLPTTPQTVFPAASISKSITVGGAMSLQQAGKIDIDQPVVEYIPFFKMADDMVTQNVTLRDFMLHRTGLPRHDAAVFESRYTPSELFERLEYLDFAKPFRTNYIYSNLSYAMVGEICSIVAQKPYEQIVEEAIFNRIGISKASLRFEDFIKGDDIATGYETKDMAKDMTGDLSVKKYRPISNSSGAVNISAAELANWVNTLLNKGNFKGEQILEEQLVKEMIRPQIDLNWKGTDPNGYWQMYGLGLNLTSHRGHELVEHSGDIDGFQLQMAFLPNDKLGIVVLTNKDQGGLARFLHKIVFDKLLLLPEIDYSKITMEGYKQAFANIAATTAQSREAIKKGTSPTHKLTEFAGTYEHPAYNTITFEAKDDELYVTYGNFNQALRHFSYNTFAASRQGFDIPMSFELNPQGEINKVKAMLEPALGEPLIFNRVSEYKPSMEELKKYIGSYNAGMINATIAMKDDKLYLLVPGLLPEDELVATKENELRTKTIEGIRLKFLIDTAGNVSGAEFTHPGGTVMTDKVK